MPRLLGIAGPSEGREYPFESEVVIGRDPSVPVSIADNAASRRHCRVTRKPEGYVLVDLESLNGTLLNGVPVKERLLKHGDQLRAGQSLFLFLDREEPSGLTSVTLREGPAEFATMRLGAGELLSPAAPRLQAELEALFGFAVKLGDVQELAALQERLVRAALELCDAERGAVVLADEPDRSFSPVPLEIDRALVNEVLDGRAALLFEHRLAAPMLRPDRCLGLLYAERPRGGAFGERHLRALSALAGIAAPAVESLRTLERLRAENAGLTARLEGSELIGESKAMKSVRILLARAAPTDATVLLTGESGTGKELAARALHRWGNRKDGPFVAVNGAALSESLLESELFGHEKGAFTGAVAAKKGKLELAHGGTLFLDEIGELPLPLQAKLLRALQEREVDRVGGTRPVKVDIRLVAATNRDLAAAVKEGRFRSDLFFRLNVVAIEMPPLRARDGDALLLAQYFLAKHGEECKRRVAGFSPEARSLLKRYDWPGNVRELQNAVERAVVLGTSELVLPEDLPELAVAPPASAGSAEAPSSGSYQDAVNEAKKRIVLQAFERSGGVFTEAARILGLHPNYLHRLVASLDLRGQIRR